MGRTPTPSIDYTSRDYEGFRQAMIEELGIKMPEYTDTSSTDAGIAILECNAKMLDILSYYADIMANETLLTTCQRRSSALKWCSILSYVPREATPSQVMQVFVLTGVQTTDTIIPARTRVKTANTSLESEIIFETQQTLTIPAGALGNEQDSSGNYLYAVPAIQGTRVDGELVGSSTGTPNQRFSLTYYPVISSSVEVVVNEGSGFEPWTRVDSFIDSGPDSKHYVLTISDNDEGIIQFGDGTFGKIPFAYDSGIFANYRVGGGEKGNVGAGKITVMESNLALVSSTFNPEPVFERGFEKETVDEIRVNAPKAASNKWGALTLQDFADVVLINFPEVIFANCERDSTDTDDIHIYVFAGHFSLLDDLKRRIEEFFDENEGGRKIVGADDIYIEPAVPKPLALEATLIVQDRYSRAAVEDEVKTLLQDYFALGNYPFAQEVSLSELAAYVMQSENRVEGIKAFYFTSPTDAVITPTASEIFTLASLNITTSGGEA